MSYWFNIIHETQFTLNAHWRNNSDELDDDDDKGDEEWDDEDEFCQCAWMN